MKIAHLYRDLCSPSANPDPQGIFFDAMGTLFGLRRSVGDCYGEVAQQFGVTVDGEVLTPAFFQAFRAAPPLAFGEMDLERLSRLEFQWWRSLVMDCFERVGVLQQFEDFEGYFTALYGYFMGPDPWFVYEDVIPTLNYWQGRGVKLGVISNFDSRLLRILEALQLRDYFPEILISSRCAVAKPQPSIFHQALSLYQLRPEQAWHIGDSQREDYEGAISAGLTAFWIER